MIILYRFENHVLQASIADYLCSRLYNVYIKVSIALPVKDGKHLLLIG